MRLNIIPFSSLARFVLVLTSLWVASTSAQDDLAIQVAHHVIYSYPSETPPQSLLDLISQGKVGGVILFGSNVGDNVADVMQNLQDTYKQSPTYSGYPLLIMTDQEGGEVNRLPGGPSMSEKDVGSSSDPAGTASDVGDQAADILTSSNFNANLAPVLGVYRSPGDFLDQFERSYSDNATIVGECAAPYITSLQGGGVIATAKHFPGLGAASANQDTDAAPVTLGLSLDTIRSVDELPFSDAIVAGVDMIMPSWATYPSLDPDFPSGLSTKWIQDELRGRLGFQGVTISDAIEAGGLDAFGDDDGYRAILATQAGMDIILAAVMDPSQGEGIVDSLVTALQNGTLDMDAFNDSTQRILDMKSQL